ncbi:Solute carrier family 15 member 2 [Dictyocoela muelleri]|nr:Solute carrier family 15 member 2 [Dictyocoela muelleri]
MNFLKKSSYLASIILFFKFIERCTYYSLKTIQTEYLPKLGFNSDSIEFLVHIAEIISYISPILGSIIFDILKGNNKILFISYILYIPGLLLLITRFYPVLGFIICYISGGIVKPCVVSLGAGLFKSDSDISIFMNRYYLVINCSCLITGFIVPRFDNEENVLIFTLIILSITSLIYIFHSSFIKNKIRENKADRDNDGWFWIDFYNYVFRNNLTHDEINNDDINNDDINDVNNNDINDVNDANNNDINDVNNNYRFIKNIKKTFSNMKVFIPLTFMWMLQSQKNSMWQEQAKMMDNRTFGRKIKPNSMLVLNPLFSVILIPIFSRTIFSSKLKYKTKMLISAFLGSLGFVCASIVQYNINYDIKSYDNHNFNNHDINNFNSHDNHNYDNHNHINDNHDINNHDINDNDKINILYQIPQYLFITCFEVISLISTTDYAYRYSPSSTKPLVLACLYSSVAIGNFWVILYKLLSPMSFFFKGWFVLFVDYLVYAGINLFMFWISFLLIASKD